MDAATAALGLTWIALSAYAVLAGADFGAGVWDLLAGSTDAGRPRRTLIEHVIGPVWEANHVWLIFVLVLLWTAFPPVFAAVASTLWIPLTLAALGIIARGSAFAFRKAVTEVWQQRLFGAAFAASSLITPFFLGTAAGAIASGRVPRGVAGGDPVDAWTAPVPVFAGLLAVAACAFLAATYLCGEAVRSADTRLLTWFRRRALASGLLTGALALAGLLVVRAGAHALVDGLFGRGLTAVLVSIVAGTATLVLIGLGRFGAARVTAALAVTGLVWGWGLAQYPRLLPGLDVAGAAAVPATLHAMLWVSIVGLVLLVPCLAWLFLLFQRPSGVSGASAERAAAPR